jgi:hypothetical protein
MIQAKAYGMIYIVRIEGWNILNKQVEVSKVVAWSLFIEETSVKRKNIEDDEKEVN